MEEHTRALKMMGTSEHFNEHAYVAVTAVHNVLQICYSGVPDLNMFSLNFIQLVKVEKNCFHFSRAVGSVSDCVIVKPCLA